MRAGTGAGAIGQRVREERLRQHIGVRELARRIGVSPGLISQVELGRASPSVGTLYAIVNVLGLSLDRLLLDTAATPEPPSSRDGAHPAAPAHPAHAAPVVRRGAGQVVELASGVRWERLTPPAPQDVDFVSVVYDVGGESCPADAPIRHAGNEFGHVLSGSLGVTIGSETYELGPGDSISFASTIPHRLFNAGQEPVTGIWFVVGRRGDPRVGP